MVKSFMLNVPYTIVINPLQPSVAFLYPLKISENLWFSDVFRGYRKATLGCNGLNKKSLDVHVQVKGCTRMFTILESSFMIILSKTNEKHSTGGTSFLVF